MPESRKDAIIKRQDSFSVIRWESCLSVCWRIGSFATALVIRKTPGDRSSEMQSPNEAPARSEAETAASLPQGGGIIIDLQVYALPEQIYRRLGLTARAE